MVVSGNLEVLNVHNLFSFGVNHGDASWEVGSFCWVQQTYLYPSWSTCRNVLIRRMQTRFQLQNNQNPHPKFGNVLSPLYSTHCAYYVIISLEHSNIFQYLYFWDSRTTWNGGCFGKNSHSRILVYRVFPKAPKPLKLAHCLNLNAQALS